MKLTSTHYFIIAVVVVFVGLIGWKVYESNKPGIFDSFAQCLADEGAVFYGAFWCPHCADQKNMFGNSDRLLPYKECSLPSGQGQNEECNAAGIETYPTWDFADGTRAQGVQSISTLAEKTNCELPETRG